MFGKSQQAVGDVTRFPGIVLIQKDSETCRGKVTYPEPFKLSAIKPGLGSHRFLLQNRR